MKLSFADLNTLQPNSNNKVLGFRCRVTKLLNILLSLFISYPQLSILIQKFIFLKLTKHDINEITEGISSGDELLVLFFANESFYSSPFVSGNHLSPFISIKDGSGNLLEYKSFVNLQIEFAYDRKSDLVSNIRSYLIQVISFIFAKYCEILSSPSQDFQKILEEELSKVTIDITGFENWDPVRRGHNPMNSQRVNTFTSENSKHVQYTLSQFSQQELRYQYCFNQFKYAIYLREQNSIKESDIILKNLISKISSRKEEFKQIDIDVSKKNKLPGGIDHHFEEFYSNQVWDKEVLVDYILINIYYVLLSPLRQIVIDYVKMTKDETKHKRTEEQSEYIDGLISILRYYKELEMLKCEVLLLRVINIKAEKRFPVVSAHLQTILHCSNIEFLMDGCMLYLVGLIFMRIRSFSCALKSLNRQETHLLNINQNDSALFMNIKKLQYLCELNIQAKQDIYYPNSIGSANTSNYTIYFINLLNKFIVAYKLNLGIEYLESKYQEDYVVIENTLSSFMDFAGNHLLSDTHKACSLIKAFLENPKRDQSNRSFVVKTIRDKLIKDHPYERQFFCFDLNFIKSNENFMNHLIWIFDGLTKSETQLGELENGVNIAMIQLSQFNYDMRIAFRWGIMHNPDFLLGNVLIPLLCRGANPFICERYENFAMNEFLQKYPDHVFVLAILQVEQHYVTVIPSEGRGNNERVFSQELEYYKTYTNKAVHSATLVGIKRDQIQALPHKVFKKLKIQEIRNMKNNCWYASSFLSAALLYNLLGAREI